MVCKKKEAFRISLIFLEATILVFFFSLLISNVFAVVGENNVTVQSQLDIGNVFPDVLNVSLQDGDATLSLTPNSTTSVNCVALVQDYNGDGDITSAYAEFFDFTNSFLGDSDDNNYHYTNSSCTFETDFGSWNGQSDDAYTALVNCTFDTWYYANAGEWTCSVVASDTYNWQDSGEDNITVSQLLALGLPDVIYYGEVNATYVSDENITNVTNFGNVAMNLSLSGYAISEGDGYAMNCSLGSVGYIPIGYEKYNLSDVTSGSLTLSEFESLYTNLTSSPVVEEFNLNYRQNDVTNEATNWTYWRIYVPLGVAGTCQGNIVFGAVEAPAS